MAMVLKTIVAATSPWVRIPRPPLRVTRCIHRSGKALCDRRDPLRIQDPCLRIPDIAVRRYVNARFIRRAEARMQAAVTATVLLPLPGRTPHEGGCTNA